jgi:predicted Zn-ribbon and HTH transcriptional regulator
MTTEKSDMFSAEISSKSPVIATMHKSDTVNQKKANVGLEISSDISTILSLLSKGLNDQELRPKLKPELGGIIYVLGENFEVTYEKLRMSEKKGLLNSKGSMSFSACQKCESVNLRAQLVCPECKSQTIFKSDLLIHYDCQTTGPIEEFHSALRDGYYCKRCRKDLKRVGIDYGNPGIGFKCSSCEKVFQFPLVLSYCEAGHVSKIDEIDLRSYPIYVLGENAKSLSTLMLETKNLRNVLEEKNIHSQVLCQLRGSSGSIHVVPLLLSPPSGEQVALDFIHGDSQEAVEGAILQLLLKNADLGKMKMLIIVDAASSIERITPMINPEKVKILAVPSGVSIAASLDLLSEQIVKELIGRP